MIFVAPSIYPNWALFVSDENHKYGRYYPHCHMTNLLFGDDVEGSQTGLRM